jgi:hypothetical protein
VQGNETERSKDKSSFKWSIIYGKYGIANRLKDIITTGKPFEKNRARVQFQADKYLIFLK